MSKIALFILFLLPFSPLLADEKGRCPFCEEEIVEKQSLAKAGAMAFYPHKPVVQGHVLVIPERHVDRFDELTTEEFVEIGEMIKRVHAASQQIYGNEDYLLLQKNGKSAGRSVPHLHFHYLPRSSSQGHVLFAIRLLAMPFFPTVSDERMREDVGRWREVLGKRDR